MRVTVMFDSGLSDDNIKDSLSVVAFNHRHWAERLSHYSYGTVLSSNGTMLTKVNISYKMSTQGMAIKVSEVKR